MVKAFVAGKLSDPLQAINTPKALRFCFDVLKDMVTRHEERLGM